MTMKPMRWIDRKTELKIKGQKKRNKRRRHGQRRMAIYFYPYSIFKAYNITSKSASRNTETKRQYYTCTNHMYRIILYSKCAVNYR